LSAKKYCPLETDMVQDQFVRMAADKLREVHGISSVQVGDVLYSFMPGGLEAIFSIQVNGEKEPYLLQVIFKGSFDRAVVDRLLQDLTTSDGGVETLVVTPYVNPSLAEYMNSKSLNFIDSAGNVRLALGGSFFAFVKGRKLKEGSPNVLKSKIAGYQTIFSILAEPSLIKQPVRHIAEVAGVGKSAVSSRITKLAHDGYIGKSTRGWEIIRYDDLLDLWLTGYSEVVAPRLVLGKYKTRISDPDELESAIEKFWETFPIGPYNWAWGGLSAEWRMVRYYRGDITTLHTTSDNGRPIMNANLLLETHALPSEDGNLIILKPFGSISLMGIAEHLVHPLLVYTQLITSNDPRARESAQEIRDYLPQRK
jgi:hypothetical protein